jgi:hypothetical protein
LKKVWKKYSLKDPKGRKWKNLKRKREHDRKIGTKESSCGSKQEGPLIS